MPNIYSVPLSQLVVDPRCQARVKMRKATVREYAEAYSRGDKLPPLKGFAEGRWMKDEGRSGEPPAEARIYIGDGMHREAALRSLALPPETRVEVEIFEGGQRGAFLYALGANAEHGLARTNADKRHAVELALGDEELRRQSDRALAKLCAVSHNFVNEVRKQLREVSSDDSSLTFDDIRVGQDGKVRKLPKRASGTSSTPMKSPVLPEKIADSTLSPGEVAEARPFNVVEAHRELDGELKRLLAKFPRALRHGACVALRNAAIEADPEAQDLTQTAFDELLRKDVEGGSEA